MRFDEKEKDKLYTEIQKRQLAKTEEDRQRVSR